MDPLAYISDKIVGNQAAVAVITGVLILSLLVLLYLYSSCRKSLKKSGFEGLAAAPSSHKAPCPKGYTLRTDGTSQYCVPAGYKANMSACNTGWEPQAVAEAQALATVGSYQHDDYGETNLQAAINSAYDANMGLSESQLAKLMRHHNNDAAAQ